MALVVLLHGIKGSPKDTKNLEISLKNKGYQVINQAYASTEFSLEELSSLIYQELSCEIQKAEEVHWIGYSMGGLLIRKMDAQYALRKKGRMIHIGTPNLGSEFASVLKDCPWYQKSYGPSGQELTIASMKQWNDSISSQLGVIAGDRYFALLGMGLLFPFFRGRHDGRVSLKSVRRSMSQNWSLVHESHGKLANHPKTVSLCLHFLKHGKFEV